MDPSVQQFLSERFSNKVDTKIHHRQMLVVSGAEVWCLNQVEQLITRVINYTSFPLSDTGPLEILTCGADLPKFLDSGTTERDLMTNRASTSNKQFRQHLGREYDLLVYNAWRGCRASALGALSGTIKKNGLLILLCPELQSWPHYRDDELANRISWGSVNKITSSHFVQHLVNVIKSDDDVLLLNEYGLGGHNHPVDAQHNGSHQHIEMQNTQQRSVIELIKKVATGHRKRPLVITAERGRGKSAAIGIAVAELLAGHKKKPTKKILVTAPQKTSVETLFRHAIALSPNVSDHLHFCAVDDLILNLPSADLLIVDEAAAIPVAQLQTLCEHYHRMVFSTTTHGYEGSGRGFDVRFKPWLNKNRPDAKYATLALPFRWYQEDCLEKFWWKTLHLKPEHPDSVVTGNNLAGCRQAKPAVGSQFIFKEVSKTELLENQPFLNAVFSLLVDAHYQTTPDDLVAILDAPEQRLFVLFKNKEAPENIAGVLSGGIEGEINDDKLTLNIVSGQRRIQGHMLPQQLAYGAGHKKLLYFRYFRVIRIAVKSALRNHGIGSSLLEHIQQWCADNNIQIMGSSFGASTELLKFWIKAEYEPVLLGFHRDKATAEFNLTVIKQLHKDTDLTSVVSLLRNNMEKLLNYHITDIWKRLDNRIIMSLLLSLQKYSAKKFTLSSKDKELLELFYKGNRSLELSCTALQSLVLSNLSQLINKPADYSALIDYGLKKLNSTELVQQHTLQGKKQLLTEMKKQVRTLLHA